MTTMTKRTPTAPPLLRTIAHVEEALDVSRSTVYALLRAGQLEGVKVGRHTRVVATSVESYVERLRTGAV